MNATHIPIRFDAWFARLSTVLLMPPRKAYIAIGADIDVCMAWGFRARFPHTAASVGAGSSTARAKVSSRSSGRPSNAAASWACRCGCAS